MKKILSIILALLMVASFASCKGDTKETLKDDSEITQTNKSDGDVVSDAEADTKEETAQDKNTQSNQTSDKNQTQQSTQTEPAQKPSQTPEKEPDKSPSQEATTLGQTLLSDFKSKAASGMSISDIADSILKNPAIKFSGASMSVEPGLLSGFDNAEITGFKSGVMFAPMIGSIAFVGYVFELENASDTQAFITNLRNNANLRWNICVAADEIVTGSSGNKVFFVMCPTALEE